MAPSPYALKRVVDGVGYTIAVTSPKPISGGSPSKNKFGFERWKGRAELSWLSPTTTSSSEKAKARGS
jgi:hypothetical protein